MAPLDVFLVDLSAIPYGPSISVPAPGALLNDTDPDHDGPVATEDPKTPLPMGFTPTPDGAILHDPRVPFPMIIEFSCTTTDRSGESA